MAKADDKLAWFTICRRFALCVGAAIFFGGWADALGARDNLAVSGGAFILAFFVPLRELRLARDPATSIKRIV